ncbi:MAG TPA: DNA-processing protein DprA [Candidatus Obscuribacterales bacterium]
MIGTENSLTIMRLLHVPGLGPAKVNALLNWCEKSGLSPSVFDVKPEALKDKLTEEQLNNFQADDRIQALEKELEDKGVYLLCAVDEAYPATLKAGMKTKAPPLLYCRGNRKLLSSMSVGFCGSRKASEKGIDTARDCAEQLAKNDFTIVSGYAAGVDITTHRAALAAGGTTLFVLPEGILHFRIKQEIKDVWDWDRVAVVSQFEPKLPWSVHNAMARNSVICAIANAMILIEAGTTGGSIAAGRTCLEMGKPLFAPVYDGMPESAAGNRLLLKTGARPLGKNRHTNRAAIDRVIESAKAAETDEQIEQIRLFG